MMCFLLQQSRGRTAKAEEAAPPKVSEDEYERAEKAIFDALGRLEGKVQHAVEDEVDSLFHELDHHEKEAIKAKVKASVKKSTKKVKKNVEDHNHSKEETLPMIHPNYPYPYNWPIADPDHRLLHAVESAEKAVLHAVEEEVSSIFHELHHEEEVPEETAKKTKRALKKVHEKASKHVEEKHKHRRNWFKENLEGNPIEEYMKADVEPME